MPIRGDAFGSNFQPTGSTLTIHCQLKVFNRALKLARLNGNYLENILSINCFTGYIRLSNSFNWFDNLPVDSTKL
jgi:hypothetical protein